MPPLSGLESITGSLGASGLSSLPSLTGTDRAAGDSGASFAESVTGAVDELRRLQSTSNELAVAAVTGDLDDIHSAMIASTRASVTLELISAVRNKGVDAFNEIMRMQA